MRSLLYLLCLAFSVAPAAQTVSTLTLSTPIPKDGLYVDPSGQLFASTGFNDSDIYTIAPDGTAAVFATGLDGPIQITQSSDGNYYATDFSPTSATAGTVSQITPDGQRSVYAQVPAGPADIVAGPDGTLYVAHYGNPNTGNGNRISRLVPGAKPEPFSVGGLLRAPVGLDIDEDGTLYVSNIFDGRITQVAPDGTQTLLATLPRGTASFAVGHVVWANGRLYATHYGANQIVAIERDGTTTVLAGSGTRGNTDGPADEASFDRPNGIAASVTGDTLFVGQAGVENQGRIRVIAGVLASVDAEAPAGAGALELRSSPNPFLGETTLTFDLGAPAEVELTVYDLLGREVDRVAVGPLGAGPQAVRWAPEALPAGTYLVRLRAGNATATRRVVVQGR